MNRLPRRFLFMKVGNHANETWEQILERKRREHDATGRIFWGYGGSACHPINQVQPFARLSIKEQGGICLVMEPIDSNADQDELPATEYSSDGVVWQPIPKGIKVTGSRYAMVLDEIKPNDLDLPLDEYEVAYGPSKGKPACEYLRGRTDKGCLVKRAVSGVIAPDDRIVRKVGFIAELKEPYAVLLR